MSRRSSHRDKYAEEEEDDDYEDEQDDYEQDDFVVDDEEDDDYAHASRTVSIYPENSIWII